MIKMKSGVYGMPVKQPNGTETVKRVGPEYGPFSIAPEKEARLVARGVAVYVQQPEPAETSDPIGFDEVPEDEAELIPLEELSAKELREMGAEYGLTFKGNASKAAMIEAITAAQAQGVEDDGESAPTFDPSEAVQ